MWSRGDLGYFRDTEQDEPASGLDCHHIICLPSFVVKCDAGASAFCSDTRLRPLRTVVEPECKVANGKDRLTGLGKLQDSSRGRIDEQEFGVVRLVADFRRRRDHPDGKMFEDNLQDLGLVVDRSGISENERRLCETVVRNHRKRDLFPVDILFRDSLHVSQIDRFALVDCGSKVGLEVLSNPALKLGQQPPSDVTTYICDKTPALMDMEEIIVHLQEQDC